MLLYTGRTKRTKEKQKKYFYRKGKNIMNLNQEVETILANISELLEYIESDELKDKLYDLKHNLIDLKGETNEI